MKKDKKTLLIELIIAAIISTNIYMIFQYIFAPAGKIILIGGICINAVLLILMLLIILKLFYEIAIFASLILISVIIFVFSIIDHSNYLYFFMLSLPMVIGSYILTLSGFISISVINITGIIGITMIFNDYTIEYTLQPTALLLILFATICFFIKYRNTIEKDNQQIIVDTFDSTLYILAYQAEIRNHETGQHLERVSAYVRLLIKELMKFDIYKNYITDRYKKDIVKASILHDIGKVGVPDTILLKPNKLTPDEFKIIQSHCKLGTQILQKAKEGISSSSLSDLAIQITQSHHEKWNGTGYPDKLHGEHIPLSARIVAVADVYDALRTKRPYKKAYTHDECCEIIINESSKHFDPRLIACFINVHQKFKRISESENLTNKIIVKSFNTI